MIDNDFQRAKRYAATSLCGFTLMELLVTIAIILVLAAIATPVYTTVRTNGYKAEALGRMNQLGTAFASYVAENQNLPREDAAGKDTWANAADPENDEVWYNALPRLVGQKGVGDYAMSPQSFYNKANMLYLPGAKYPEQQKQLSRPRFAMAMNSRIQRKNDEGVKEDVVLAEIAMPSRTVMFLETGLAGESKDVPAQGKYGGKAKANARAFVARYHGEGVITFFDGHAELVKTTDLLNPAGVAHFPQVDYIWTTKPEDDPN